MGAHLGNNLPPATRATVCSLSAALLPTSPHQRGQGRAAPAPEPAPGAARHGRDGSSSPPSVSGTGFPYEKVVQRVLYLQVLDYDRFSRNDPIGEVSIPLNKVDLTQMQTFWKDLKPCSDGSVRPRSPSHPLGTVLEGRLPPVPVASRWDHHPLATPMGIFSALREGLTPDGEVSLPKSLY